MECLEYCRTNFRQVPLWSDMVEEVPFPGVTVRGVGPGFDPKSKKPPPGGPSGLSGRCDQSHIGRPAGGRFEERFHHFEFDPVDGLGR